MIVDQIDFEGVFAFETKDDPPIGPHCYGPEALPPSFQRVEAEAVSSD